jgi:hypothetical protein
MSLGSVISMQIDAVRFLYGARRWVFLVYTMALSFGGGNYGDVH